MIESTSKPRNEVNTSPPTESVTLFSLNFAPIRFTEAINAIMALAHRNEPTYVVTANVDHIVRLHRQPELMPLYTQADLIVADGMPLIWASKFLGKPLPERVTGSDLFPALCAQAAKENCSVFLMGGAPGSADKAIKIMQQRHPKLRVAGTHCPDYSFERDPEKSQAAINAVRAAKPDLLFVGLGSPKQERWIVQNKNTCGAKCSLGVGISFSFIAGDVPRAPRWMQRAGLEWFHRLCQEPSRLWKRYLIDDPYFVALVLQEKRTQSKAPKQPKTEPRP